MKICFVVHTFDKKDRGGVLRVISQLANRLVENYDTTIMSLGIINDRSFELDSRVNLVSLGMNKYNTKYYKSLGKLKWFKEAYALIKKEMESDTIWITSSPPISLLFSLLKLNNNKLKVIGCDHTSTLYQKKFLTQKIRNFLLSNLNVMIALTPQDQIYYSSNDINSVYIPNGIDMSEIKIFDNYRKYLIFVGRLEEEKQPFKAIDLYISSDLPKKNIKMKIYGHGEYENNIHAYIRERKAENLIELIKGETNPDIIYKDAFALILTSKVEGFGMVLLESISRGIPCLSYDCPYGPRNIIKNGINGFLIADNQSDFSDKVVLLEDINVNNIIDSINEFDMNLVLGKYTDVINSF